MGSSITKGGSAGGREPEALDVVLMVRGRGGKKWDVSEFLRKTSDKSEGIAQACNIHVSTSKQDA